MYMYVYICGWFCSDDKELQSSFDEQEKQQESSSTYQGKCQTYFNLAGILEKILKDTVHLLFIRLL